MMGCSDSSRRNKLLSAVCQKSSELPFQTTSWQTACGTMIKTNPTKTKKVSAQREKLLVIFPSSSRTDRLCGKDANRSKICQKKYVIRIEHKFGRMKIGCNPFSAVAQDECNVKKVAFSLLNRWPSISALKIPRDRIM